MNVLSKSILVRIVKIHPPGYHPGWMESAWLVFRGS